MSAISRKYFLLNVFSEIIYYQISHESSLVQKCVKPAVCVTALLSLQYVWVCSNESIYWSFVNKEHHDLARNLMAALPDINSLCLTLELPWCVCLWAVIKGCRGICRWWVTIIKRFSGLRPDHVTHARPCLPPPVALSELIHNLMPQLWL